MKQMSDDDLAVRALQVFRDEDPGQAMSAIARLAASLVIGGMCDRHELFAAIDVYLDTATN